MGDAAVPAQGLRGLEGVLHSLEGTPRIVVSDADPTIVKAMDAVFLRLGDPFPEHRISEHHIKRAIEEYMPTGLLYGPDPIGRSYGMALTSTEHWAAFVEACEEEAERGRYPMTRLMKWLDRYGARVAAQAATRRPELPNSTGPVEAVLRELGVRIESRTGGFTNRARMEKLLMLVCADMRKRSNGRVWADLLRKRIYLAGGHPHPQRPHDDRRGVHSLLA